MPIMEITSLSGDRWDIDFPDHMNVTFDTDYLLGEETLKLVSGNIHYTMRPRIREYYGFGFTVYKINPYPFKLLKSTTIINEVKEYA